MGVGQVTPRVAIFDRDGTIIDVVRDEETGAIVTAFHPIQIRLLSGAVEGMLALQGAGFVIAIATNQPGPAKGQCSAAAVIKTNEALVARLAERGVKVAAVEACMHHPDGGDGGDPALVKACACRKPKAGLLESHPADDRRGPGRVVDDRGRPLGPRGSPRGGHARRPRLFLRPLRALPPREPAPKG